MFFRRKSCHSKSRHHNKSGKFRRAFENGEKLYTRSFGCYRHKYKCCFRNQSRGPMGCCDGNPYKEYLYGVDVMRVPTLEYYNQTFRFGCANDRCRNY